MIKKKIFFISCLLTLLLQAGTLSSQSLQTVPKIGFGINGLDLSIEIPITEKITIEPSIGLGPSYNNKDWNDDNNGWEYGILVPSVHVGVYGKIFYNRNKRMIEGKSVHLNSGNFFGLKVKYVTKTIINDYPDRCNTLLAILNWGGQHNIGRHWTYGYSVGLGYNQNLDVPYNDLHLALDLKIAYVLPFFRPK